MPNMQVKTSKSRATPKTEESQGSFERIAIVGMACRFPGASDLDTFWSRLCAGVNSRTECPAGLREGRVGQLYEDTVSIPSACRFGAFLSDIDQFDAEFFRISPSEAEFLDPQQRMMLETCWQALENANIDPMMLRGTPASVFAGMSNNDYRYLILDGADTSNPAASLYTITGTSLNTAIGRVSFALDLEGPAMTVDTACSSSLVAMHQAASALHSRETDLALVGGVQLILSGKLTELRANAGMLSPDGTCKTFDERANGYVRGEGCGIVVLKRLVDAEADGDNIWAVVRSTAINQDGLSEGLTVPRGTAQRAVIRDALERANLDPNVVDYLEAHGTGTPVGDPVEINAAADIYGSNRDQENPLLIGSVKTNIGHLEPAAGVAGVIKTALALKFGIIPRHINFEKPNPAIDWDGLPVQVVSDTIEWREKVASRRFAGINSFGFSGTNAHVVLQGYDDVGDLGNSERVDQTAQHDKTGGVAGTERVPNEPNVSERSKRILPLSAKSVVALRELASKYVSLLDESEEQSANLDLADLAWTAGVGRSHFNVRRGVVFDTRETLVEQLNQLVSVAHVDFTKDSSKVAFAYTGQGSQWSGMGKALYESEPAFRDALDVCEKVIQRERKTTLIGRIFGTTGYEADLENPAWVQPAIYALECALTNLWRHLGIEPDVVFGHSLGEIAAARTAGIFSLEDGCIFASTRGRLMSELRGPGAMAAVFVSEEDAQSILRAYNEESDGVGISIAAYNGAHQVMSGLQEELEPLLVSLEKEDIRVRRLAASPAYHSALVDPILDELAECVSRLEVNEPQCLFVSNLTGKPLSAETRLDSDYWRQHARESVVFRKGVAAVAELDVNTILEVGPNFVLGPMSEICWPAGLGQPPSILGSIRMPREDHPEDLQDGGFFENVAKAYESGVDICFRNLHTGETRRKLNLPGYPFQRTRHWVESKKRRTIGTDHPLLGSKRDSAYGEVTYETELFSSDPVWLNEHRVFGHVLLPGSFYGSMALAAADGFPNPTLEDFQLYSPMIFEEASETVEEPFRRVQLLLQAPDDNETRYFEIHSKGQDDEKWVQHASGKINVETSGANGVKQIDASRVVRELTRRDVGEYYETKSQTNIQLGTPFRTLKNIWSDSGEAVAEISVESADADLTNGLHPLQLDACFQVLSAARGSLDLGSSETYIPFGWERLNLWTPLPATFLCRAQMIDLSSDENSDPTEQTSPETLSGDLWFYDRSGNPLGELKGFVVKRASRSSLLSTVEDPSDLFYEVVWRNVEHPTKLRSEHPLPEVDDLKSGVAPFFDYLNAQGVKPEERYDLLLDLEKLAHSWVLHGFDEAGWSRQVGERIDADALISQFGISTIHSKLVQRMLEFMSVAGILVKSADGGLQFAVSMEQATPDGLGDPNLLLEEFKNKHPHGLYELTLLSRFGARLLPLLKEEVDPLALLFDEASSGAADFYKTAAVLVAGNRLLGDVISRLIRDLPSDRPLRIVEVGAGTGATSEIVFDELVDTEVNYTYTDISAGFFSEAERRFADNGLQIEYRVLNIEIDPLDQGFGRCEYDIVIAANVLHATRNLHETLSNCRELLVPGGMLVALESLRGRAWQDMTFGFLDGWWRYDDAYRKTHALASPEVWRKALSEAGYEDSWVFGSETISETSGPLGSGTIVAKVPNNPTMRDGTWVVEKDDGSVAEELVRVLEGMNQRVIVSDFDGDHDRPAEETTTSIVSHEDLLDVLENLPANEPLRGVVHLAALSGPGIDADTEEVATEVRRISSSALSLSQILMESGLTPSNGTWFVTRGAQVLEQEREGQLTGSALWGLGKVLDLEAPHLSPRMVDLSPYQSTLDSLTADLISPDTENHIAYRDGSRYLARLVRFGEGTNQTKLPSEPNWVIDPGQDGSLGSVSTVQLPSTALDSGEVRIHVESVGLNFSDVLVALGAQDPAASLGLEFAGYILETANDVNDFNPGDRVVGMGFGTFGPRIITKADLVAQAPEHLTFNELAAIPIVFATAALAFDLAKLRKNDRVLVHSAAGGVGLAAIQLVQAAGAEVYATASTSKHEFLRRIGIQHVFDSRSTDFGQAILADTDGGVDIVLNSLTSEGFIDASLSCLKKNGRFIEIGRLNIFTEEDMTRERPDVDYHVLSLDDLKRNQSEQVGVAFRSLMDRFASGELVSPLHTTWSIAEIGEAMQFMGSARHIGKNVLSMPPFAQGDLPGDRTFLITGGFGGIGCAVAQWLVDRGATSIVLNGRRPPEEDAQKTIEDLRSRGIRVESKIADVSEAASLTSMLEEIENTLPPLGGVIHSVGVLSDGSIPNQTWQRFEEVLWPKILGAWHLHHATKHLDLNLFVLFSSATGVMGNAGQANHAAANAFLDQLAAHRRSIGLAGQSIAWGAWSQIGEAAEQRTRIETQLESTGTGWIAPELGIKALDLIVTHNPRNVAAMSVDWDILEDHLAARPALLKELLTVDEGDEELSMDLALDVPSLSEANVEERIEVLVPFLQKQVQSILRLQSQPSPSVGFFDLGMDSLMAVELRNRLIRIFEGVITVSNTAVFDFPSVEALAEHLAEELGDESDELSVAQSSDSSVGFSNCNVGVIGMACRFPGAADYGSFWKNIEQGTGCISSSRGSSTTWNGVVGDESSPESYVRYGGFIDGIDEFDAKFFGILPIDARMMDPRQRLLLETCWEAIENAAINADTLRGSRVGLYIGLGASEYRDLINGSSFEDNYLGTSSGMTTGRIAHMFGLMGPAMSFDLACASSLVAIHEGSKALQRGEVDIALVGGANALLSPSIMRFHREIGLLSDDGHCLPFDEEASGYIRGEGCGILILKRLEDAEESGDPIWATVAGSAVNQNGVSAGLTVPNGSAQSQVILDAVTRAEIAPEDVDYLEAHATGLPQSDSIELGAAASVYGGSRELDRPLFVGSVKNLIGHLEWAAGIAGTIKIILSMKNQKIPAQSQIRKLNEEIEWSKLSLDVNQSTVDWALPNGKPQLGAVSAFGMSGTNAHALIENYTDPSEDNGIARASDLVIGRPISVTYDFIGVDGLLGVEDWNDCSIRRRWRLLPLSGRTPRSVVALSQKYASWLEVQRDHFGSDYESFDELLADVAWTASVGRKHFEHRQGVAFQGIDDLIKGLTLLATDESLVERADHPEPQKIAFAFSSDTKAGLDVGRTLYETEPVVRGIIDHCRHFVLEEANYDLLELTGENDSEHAKRVFMTHFAVQCAIAAYWKSMGINPDVILSDRVSLLSALCTTDALSLDDALRIAIQGTIERAGQDNLRLNNVKTKIVSNHSETWSDSSGDTRSLLETIDFDATKRASISVDPLVPQDVDCVIEIGPCKLSEADANEVHQRLISCSNSLESDENENAFHQSLIHGMKTAYEARVPLRLSNLFAGESRRRLTVPTYQFDRKRYWFNDPVE